MTKSNALRSSASNKSPAFRLLAALATLPLVTATAAYAANDVWIGNTDANFATLSNWTGSVSPNNNTPVFGTAGTAGAVLNNDLSGATYAGLTFNAGASAFTIGGNSFTLTGNVVNNSTGTQTINTPVTLSGARTFAATSGQLAFGGNITGTPGSWTLTPTNKITLGGANSLTMSANFAGLIINAGAGGVDITGSTAITGAAGNAQSGYMNVLGTTTVAIKSGGSLTINGTTNTTPGGIIGQNTAGTSTLSVESGGSFTYGGNVGLAFGNNRTDAIGVLEVSGSASIASGSSTATDQRSFVSLGRDSGTGTVNLNTGGVLATGRNFIRDGSATADTLGAANFNFKGGTLKALATQGDWLNSSTKNTNQLALSSVTTTSAASTIDPNGFSVAINNAISGTGGFIINSSTGTGTVTFGGASTYTGPTKVGSGTFALGAAGSIASSSGVEIATGAIFNTAAQSFTMGAGQTLTFDLDGSGAGSSGLFQAAALNIGSGSVSFSVTGSALNDASYVLVNYTSIAGATFGTVNNLPAGYTLDYNYLGGNQIALVAVPEPSTFAAIAGLAGLGAAGLRRRRATRRSVGLIG